MIVHMLGFEEQEQMEKFKVGLKSADGFRQADAGWLKLESQKSFEAPSSVRRWLIASVPC